MQTNFFTQIAAMKLTGNFRLNIQRQDNGSFIVSALLTNDHLKDKSPSQIPPLILAGFADDLDSGFFLSIEKPVQKNNALLCNMAEHEKAMDKAKKDADAKRSNTSSQSSPKRKKFDEQMKKVTDLETQKKYGEAISQLPKEKEYPEFAKEISQKMKELRGKHGSLSLFEEEQPEPTASGETDEQDTDNDTAEDVDDDDNDNDDFDENEQ